MSTCVFVQIRCRPGTTYRVAEEIALREIHSELYSTSGDFDLLMKLYIPKGEDIGVYINDHLLDIDGIERSRRSAGRIDFCCPGRISPHLQRGRSSRTALRKHPCLYGSVVVASRFDRA